MDEGDMTAQDLLKTTNILTCKPDDTLTHALALLLSTHDAVFVFDDSGQLLGAVSPYHVLYRSKYPAETKVTNCLFKPPILSPQTPVWDIAHDMLESKIYFLPVYEDGEFLGIVTINRLLRAFRNNQALLKQLAVPLKKELITVKAGESTDVAYTKMRDGRVSRLPVVDAKNKLVGLVTRYDLREAFMSPKERQRFLSRVGDKRKQLSHSLDKYSKKMVATVLQGTDVQRILETMLERKVGSVVILDESIRPVGLVSHHDVLAAIVNIEPQPETPLALVLSPRFPQPVYLEGLLKRFIHKINTITPIVRVDYKLDTQHNSAGRASRFDASVQVHLKDGRELIAKAEDFDWKKTVNISLSKIERQLQ